MIRKTLLLCAVVLMPLCAQVRVPGSWVFEGGANAFADSGAANAYVISAAISAYDRPAAYCFLPAHTNTGASTIQFGMLASITIQKSGATALSGGEIIVNQPACGMYDGTFFQLQGTSSALGPIASNNTLCNSTGGAAAPGACSPMTMAGILQLPLASDFAQKLHGSGAPGSVTSNLPGDLYYDTMNSNVYGCLAPFATATPACTAVAANNWVLLNSGGTGSFATLTGGTNTAAAMICGNGCSIAPTGTGTVAANNVGAGLILAAGNFAYNTAVVTGVQYNQSGIELKCNSTTGNTTYACSLLATGSAALTGYTTGMLLHLVVDTTSSTPSTLNVDTNGAKTLDQADCATAIGTSISANQMYQVWYNGTVFCLVH